MSIDKSPIKTSPAPHFHSGVTISSAMTDLFIALMPITIVSLFMLGPQVLILLATCVTGALLGEVAARKYKGEEITLYDGTALITGVLLALILPPAPWWAMVPLYTIGGFFSTAIVKEAMGGLGRNRFNPALSGRVLLLFGRNALIYMVPFILSISEAFEPYLHELEVIDLVSAATPLYAASEGLAIPEISSMFLAYEGGAPAETSVLAVLAGGIYLIVRGHIKPHIPVSVISTFFIMALIFSGQPFFHLLGGGLFFGSFFMATDWVTCPLTSKGQIIYGVGIGILIALFRFFIADLWVSPGGVAFSILIMNGFVRYIDKLTARPKYGQQRRD